ncbi:MAG: D-alanine--D-alanine ligase family protein [Candidatus Deferrimicrobiaceae bacterium]
MQGGLPPKHVAILYTPVEDTLQGVEGQMRIDLDLAVSARQVRTALAASGHVTRPFLFGKDPAALASSLRAFGTEVVFNLSECPMNSAQKEPHGAALLELLGLPYTGNSPLPLTVCNNKALTKRILSSFLIPTPAFRLYPSVPRGRSGLRFPVIVKPANEDGSAGITEESVVDDEARLKERVGHVIEKYQQGALAEEFVGGREFNVGVLGNGTATDPFRTLPPAELVYRSPRWRVCSFESKWDTDHPAYGEIAPECPANIPDALRNRLERLTLACARAFELCGYARVDFRMNRRGKLFALEVNPNPDISSNAGLDRAARAAGISYEELVIEILRLAISRGPR